MIKEVTVFSGKRTSIQYQLLLFAFKTEKGVFTLSGSNVDGTDEWRQMGTNNFHVWKRKMVYDWFLSGKIEPVSMADKIDWFKPW